jgi:two-component system, NtrC family, nitrogen regulation sensor histidine kinase NtrY
MPQEIRCPEMRLKPLHVLKAKFPIVGKGPLRRQKNAQTSPDETFLTPGDQRRRRLRNFWTFLGAVCLLIALTGAEVYVQGLHRVLPLANNIVVFAVVNVNIILLLALVLLVLRNLVKLYYERRSKIIGSRFRTKLVIAFFGLSLTPCVLLVLVASGLINKSINNWFNVSVERSLEDSLEVARNYYRLLEQNTLHYGDQIRTALLARDLLRNDRSPALAKFLEEKRREYQMSALQIFAANLQELAATMGQAAGERLPATQADLLRRRPTEAMTEIQSAGRGEVIRGIVPILGPGGVAPVAWIVLTYHVPESVVAKMGDITEAFEQYKQLKILKAPIKTSYLITLLMVALLVIFCAIWFGLYLAKGITVPIQALVEGTRAVADGNLDFRVSATSADEIGWLVHSFNQMTGDLRASKIALEAANEELKENNRELEARRSYMETVLEHVAAGVMSLDKHGRVSTMNRSAQMMLGVDVHATHGRAYRHVFSAAHLDSIRGLIKRMASSRRESITDQIQLLVGGRVLTLLVNIALLRDSNGHYLGMVLVFDDLTELIRVQKLAAWRDVAQGIAHEIKNPLTPIQLSAQRLQRKYREHARDFNEVFDECTTTIITQVEGLKGLLDEFSSFARMPESNPTLTDLHQLVEDVLHLYHGAHRDIELTSSCDPAVMKVNLDGEQMKRTLINLVENAIEAMHGNGQVHIVTSLDARQQRVCIEVHDTGVGIAPQLRDKLFLPYFTTKRGGSGLGLAIVNRIVADHNGRISVRDNTPRGSIFAIELPMA